MDWLRQMVGLSDAWTGVVHDTASTATLCALLCARERASGFSQNGGGLQARRGAAGRLRLRARATARSRRRRCSRASAATTCGSSTPTTTTRCALDLLEAAIAADSGRRPRAVRDRRDDRHHRHDGDRPARGDGRPRRSGTASGCTSTRRWPARRWCCRSAARCGKASSAADSLVFNPHKWMGVGFDFSAYYVRDAEHLIRVMSTNPSYLRTAQDGAVKNYRDWHIPLGRRFRALKLWFYLARRRRRGAAGAAPARPRERAVAARAGGRGAGLGAHGAGAAADGLPAPRPAPRSRRTRPRSPATTSSIARRVNESGAAYLTPSVLKGRQMIRVSIGAEPTERRHVEAVWAALETAARA